MVPCWTICGELDADECPDCGGTLSDEEIMKTFYPFNTFSDSQKHVAIAIGRAIATKALREAAAWMDGHGVLNGALIARTIADRTIAGEPAI